RSGLVRARDARPVPGFHPPAGVGARCGRRGLSRDGRGDGGRAAARARGLMRRALIGVALALLVGAPVAHADLRSLEAACVHRDAADGTTANGSKLPFTFCDDGVPSAGGTTPDPGAAQALAVPERYGGDGHTGLPRKAAPEPG